MHTSISYNINSISKLTSSFYQIITAEIQLAYALNILGTIQLQEQVSLQEMYLL